MQNDQLNDPIKDARETINMGIGVAQIIAMPARIWLTRPGTAGELFFGGRIAIMGWLAIPLFPMCLMPCDARIMYSFWGLTTLLMLVHRFRGRQLRKRGYRPHSQFMGIGWLSRRAPGALEGALTTGLGLMLLGVDKALGSYLAIAGFCIAVSTGYAAEVERTMLRRMDDARWDQEWMAEKMRERR